MTRGFAATAAALTCAGMLIACGSDTPTENSDVNPVACATGNETGTRLVEDTFLGDVEIPASPKRIVTGWLVGTPLIDLGVTPVGMLDDYVANATPDELAKVEGVPSIGNVGEGPNVEAVMALEPDLVITMVRADMVSELRVNELESLVPVLALEIKEPTDVWAQYPKLAEALGCGDAAAAELASLDERLAAISTDHAAAIANLGTVAYVEGSAEPATYQIGTEKSLVYQRLNLAGLNYFDGLTPDPKRYVELVSVEELDRLSSANVLLFEADFEGKPTTRTQALLDSPGFAALPAAQAGNVFPYRTPYAYTVAAVDRQISDIEAAVESASPAK